MPGNNDREHHTHIAAVIDKPGEVPAFGGIDDGVVVDSEHVTAANALILVSLLTHVSNDLQKPQAGSGHTAPLSSACARQWGFIRPPPPQESTRLTGNTEVQDGLLKEDSPECSVSMDCWNSHPCTSKPCQPLSSPQS